MDTSFGKSLDHEASRAMLSLESLSRGMNEIRLQKANQVAELVPCISISKETTRLEISAVRYEFLLIFVQTAVSFKNTHLKNRLKLMPLVV